MAYGLKACSCHPLKEVVNWFKCNKLSLNATKTNLMFVGTPHQTKNITNDNHIYLDGCKLTRVYEAKFLGITLDHNLTWRSHINSICKTCCRNIGVLKQTQTFLTKTKHVPIILYPYLAILNIWNIIVGQCQ